MPVPDEFARRFLVRGEDTIDRYPRRREDRLLLLQWIADRAFTDDDDLTESQVNERLYRYTDDVAVLRRYLVDAELLERFPDGTGYRRVRPAPVVDPPSVVE
jgi:Uncharacterized protein conserved in bacteria